MRSFYDRHLMPRLVSGVCGLPGVRRQRARVVPRAAGVVLDVGIGGGHNLPHFDPRRVKQVLGLDPTAEMVERGRSRIAASRVPVELIAAGAEEIPLPSASVDTVVLAFAGCTIPAIGEALAEMRRVLKGPGRLLFVEHGRAPEPRVARWQDRLDGIWGALAGGCHLNRDIAALLTRAGFRLETLETEYAPGVPRFAGFTFLGSARP